MNELLAQDIGTRFQDLAATGPLLLAAAACVLAGLVSFASPCVVPLVPGYVSYLASISGADQRTANSAVGGVAAGEAVPTLSLIHI